MGNSFKVQETDQGELSIPGLHWGFHPLQEGEMNILVALTIVGGPSYHTP